MITQQQESFSYGRTNQKPGTRTRGVAHDVNNILTVVINCIELAKAHLDNPGEVEASLGNAANAAEQARTLIQQIFTLKEDGDANFERVTIEPVMRTFIEMVRAFVPRDIIIECNLNITGDIMTSIGQMNRLFMNLCTNAIQAMPGGGKIGIEVKNTVLDTGNMPPQNYMIMSISDTGIGIPDKLVDRIFEPHFTTKEDGNGLGLAIVDEIVKIHKGFITCKSNEGKGSTFTVYLPMCEEGDRQQEQKKNLLIKNVQEHRPTGHTVLFVDDEQNVSFLAKEVLKRDGYEVAVASNGKEALNLFMETPDRFDIMISDINMPEMDGEELTVKVLQKRPDFPIILCTGYSNLVTRGKLHKLGVKKVLQKPYAMIELSRAIQEVLGKRLS